MRSAHSRCHTASACCFEPLRQAGGYQARAGHRPLAPRAALSLRPGLRDLAACQTSSRCKRHSNPHLATGHTPLSGHSSCDICTLYRLRAPCAWFNGQRACAVTPARSLLACRRWAVSPGVIRHPPASSSQTHNDGRQHNDARQVVTAYVKCTQAHSSQACWLTPA